MCFWRKKTEVLVSNFNFFKHVRILYFEQTRLLKVKYLWFLKNVSSLGNAVLKVIRTNHA